jgi:hypothetical protein
MGTPFIPSLKDSYIIPIANSSVTQDLKFRKLAFKNSESELCYHWVYEGKITVETQMVS